MVILGWLAAQHDAPQATTHTELCDAVLGHEQQYWIRTYRDITGQPRPVRDILRAVRCAWLLLLGVPDPRSAEVTNFVPTAD